MDPELFPKTNTCCALFLGLDLKAAVFEAKGRMNTAHQIWEEFRFNGLLLGHILLTAAIKKDILFSRMPMHVDKHSYLFLLLFEDQIFKVVYLKPSIP